MTIRLPQGDKAILDLRKIADYCLSPSHPRGRHKARVFREALGLERSDASWLRGALLEAARSGAALQVTEDAWGTYWRVDATIRRQGKSAVVRTIWILRTGGRFGSCEPAKARQGSSRAGCYDADEKRRKGREAIPFGCCGIADGSSGTGACARSGRHNR